MIFKYSELKKLLLKINRLGETIHFKDFKGQNCFLIRHDVDWDLKAALNLAIIENDIGVKSTFFIMVSSDNYNVMNYNNKNILNKIKNLGHEIGLHFDTSIYTKEFESRAIIESKILENIISDKINSISLHNPSSTKFYPEFKKFNNAYSKKYFNKKTYLADSRFNFRGKEPFKFIERIKYLPFIQVLLHPLHYSEKGDTNYISKFEKMFYDKINEFDKVQLENTKYQEDRKVKGYEIKIK